MQNNFELALAFTLPHEGFYCNIPEDKGGATNYGITQKVYDAYRVSKNIPTVSVAEITKQEAADIYKYNYFYAGHCDIMSTLLAIVHFDSCVNHGVSRAVKFLQFALGTMVDGIIGAETLNAMDACKNVQALCNVYINKRKQFYADIVNLHPEQVKFLNGWNNRVEDLRKYILTLTYKL